MNRIRHSFVGKLMLLLGIIVTAVIIMIIVSFQHSQRVIQATNLLRNTGIRINQYSHQAYTSFLTMDDQSNMWVGLNGFGNQTLRQATFNQIKVAEASLNQSLQNLAPLMASATDQSLLRRAMRDATGYEGYFSQVEKLNVTDHKAAQQIMYITNSAVSNALTTDLINLEDIGKVIVEQNAKSTLMDAKSQEQIVLFGGVIIVLFALSIMFFVYILLKPLTLIVKRVHQIADGDFSVEALRVKNKDEIGVLAESYNEMVNRLRGILMSVSDSAQHVVAASQELMANASQTSVATERIAENIQEVASGAELQSSSTNAAVTTISEIGTSAQEISNRTKSVAATSVDATALSNQGLIAIQQVYDAMVGIQSQVRILASNVSALENHSQHIGEIVNVISEISGQTNLLALNAAIEAARAGEYGRGFAVVAEEVRKLAEESAASSKQIADRIHSIQTEMSATVDLTSSVQQKVENGMNDVQTAGSAFTNIQRGIQEVSQQIAEVSSVVERMSEGTVDANQSMQNVSNLTSGAFTSTRNVSEAAQEQLASMEDIAASATELSSMAEALQEKLSHFKV